VLLGNKNCYFTNIYTDIVAYFKVATLLLGCLLSGHVTKQKAAWLSCYSVPCSLLAGLLSSYLLALCAVPMGLHSRVLTVLCGQKKFPTAVGPPFEIQAEIISVFCSKT
jgi:Na+/glutamate symporter